MELKQYKPVVINASKLKQYQYEIDTWKRLLAFTKEENILLKNRLTSILKNDFTESLLDELEFYNSRLIELDGLIEQTGNEVDELNRLLVREIFEDGKILKLLTSRLKRTRQLVTLMEKQFNRVKMEFNSYLSENL